MTTPIHFVSTCLYWCTKLFEHLSTLCVPEVTAQFMQGRYWWEAIIDCIIFKYLYIYIYIKKQEYMCEPWSLSIYLIYSVGEWLNDTKTVQNSSNKNVTAIFPHPIQSWPISAALANGKCERVWLCIGKGIRRNSVMWWEKNARRSQKGANVKCKHE